ncbi:MAG: hypothetical protein M3O50_02555 [Myxococcota bacterium]|nr:hypothetical protein [Myxococcota bacterium]
MLPTNPIRRWSRAVRGDALGGEPSRSAAILESLFTYREDLAMDHLAMRIVAVDAIAAPSRSIATARTPPSSTRASSKTPAIGLMLDKPTEFASTLRSRKTAPL